MAHLIRRHVIGIKPSTQAFQAMVKYLGEHSLVELALAAGADPRLIIARLVRNGEWQKNVAGNHRASAIHPI